MQSTIDPITLEVINHRLKSIADEMEMALLRSSFSSVVKEAQDASAALFDAQGQTVAQATALPAHLGMLMMSVPAILEIFPISEMKDGDVFLLNDPYRGGTHIPDITIVVPIIYEGEVVALGCAMTHHQDMGGRAPGSTATDATELYQEGLILPPLKFYEAGKPVEVVHEIIRSNVRIPDIVIGDIRAQVAAGNVGKLRLQELFQEYGKDVVLTAMKQLLNYAEALTRQELEKIPDGSYSFVDYLDDDGVDIGQRIKIQAEVTIRGSEFIADFSGSDPQVRGPVNCPPSATLASTAYVLRAFTGAAIPSNAGCFRPITLNLPEGSIVNPLRPAPVGVRTSTLVRIPDILMGALVKAAPQSFHAASFGALGVVILGGIDPLTNQAYVTHEIATGGLGARPNKDGIDVIATGVVNIMNPPVEALEMNYPIRFSKRGLDDGSGGAGEYRGGLGMETVWKVLRGRVTVTYRGERQSTRPWGLFGGLPAPSMRAFVLHRSGTREDIRSNRVLSLNEGDEFHYFMPGGGGYGDPLKRKPELVLRDALDGKISFEAAFEDYGAVIDPELMAVDFKKTRKAREERRELRGPITWTYDRGPELGRE